MKYRNTTVLKVETDISASITACPTMYVKIFKTGIIVFISEVKNVFDSTLNDNFQYQNQFLRMWVTNWSNIFVDQGQFSDPDFIKGKMSNLPIKQNIKSSSRNPDSSYISPKFFFFFIVPWDTFFWTKS